MITRILATLFTSTALYAATETWDGGGSNSNFSTGANWVDNSAPVSSLSNTDLVFSGGERKTPNAGTFSAHSVKFQDVEGLLILDGFSIQGTLLNVGAGGVLNNDGFDAGFSVPVSFSGVANVFSTAAAGSLYYGGTVTLPSDTLAVGGAYLTVFTNISGTGTVNRIGSGELIWQPTVAAGFDLTITTGSVRIAAPATMNASGSISVNGAGILNVDQNLTLNNCDLLRASGATIHIAAGKQITAQNGADIAITGNHSNSTISTITVTGSGSTFDCTGILGVNGGGIFNGLSDSDTTTGAVNVGTSGPGTMTIDDASLITGNFNLGIGGHDGVATFSHGAAGTLEALSVAASTTAGTGGTLNVQTGADVTVASLAVATENGSGDGVVTIEGSDSAGDARLAVNGAGATDIGAQALSTALLRIRAGGRFESSTGTTNVHGTGRIHVDGGVYDNAGLLHVRGGKLDVTSGYVRFDPSSELLIEVGGDATFAGLFSPNVAALSGDGSDVDVSVYGSGATLTAGSILIDNSNRLGARLDAAIISSGAITLGSAEGSGFLRLDYGADLTGGTLRVGSAGGVGEVVFSDNATGALNALVIGSASTSGSSGSLDILAGASVSGVSLDVGSIATDNSGSVGIVGTGSVLTLTGAANTNIGANIGSRAYLFLQDGGVFNTGTGQTTINPTGEALIFGGTLNALGNMTLNGGQLSRDATGTFKLAAGRTFTVQAGGDAVFTGDFALDACSVVVTGAGSTFLTTGVLVLGSGASVTVESGGICATGAGPVEIHETGVLDVRPGGTLAGPSDFAGAGLLRLAGAYLPGAPSGLNRTKSVSIAQDVVLHPSSVITMEIGGDTPGTDHDRLVFSGTSTPHVVWNGTLNVVLLPGFIPSAGQRFDMFDFDILRDAGAFTAINLPQLPLGLFWRTERLYTDGTLVVMTTPGTYEEWRVAYGIGEFDEDDDSDWVQNGIEFLLGTDPTSGFGKRSIPLKELAPVASPTKTIASVAFEIPEFPSADAHYRLQSSADLKTWTEIARKDGTGAWTGSAYVTVDAPSAGFIHVTVAETLPPGSAMRFHRLVGLGP